MMFVHNSINNEIRLKVESVMNKKINGTLAEKPKLIKRREGSYSDRSSFYKAIKVEKSFIEKLIGKKQKFEGNNDQIKPKKDMKIKEKIFVTTDKKTFMDDYNFIVRKTS